MQFGRCLECMKVELRPGWATEKRPRGNLGVAVLIGAVGIYQKHTAESFTAHLG